MKGTVLKLLSFMHNMLFKVIERGWPRSPRKTEKEAERAERGGVGAGTGPGATGLFWRMGGLRVAGFSIP